MNDIIPYKPLSYEEQLSRLEKMMKDFLSQKVVKLYIIEEETGVRKSPYLEMKRVKETLIDRIKKQKEEKK